MTGKGEVRRFSRTAFAAAAGAMATALAAPAATPSSHEVRINVVTTGAQTRPAIAIDALGDYAVVWTSYGQDGSGDGIYLRRFSADGTPLDAADVRVNVFTTGPQQNPAIAMDAAGDYIVAWDSAGQDGNGYGIFSRRFDPKGVPKDAADVRLNATTASDQRIPSLAMDTAGNFVAAWQSFAQDGSTYGIYARRFAANGTARDAADVGINLRTTSDQRDPSVAMDATGDYVVAWDSYGQDGDLFGIYARRYTAAGVARDAADVRVNVTTTGTQAMPRAAMDPAGNYVIAWQSTGSDDGYGVYARRFENTGLALDVQDRRISEYTTLDQKGAAIAVDAAGDYVIAWQSFGQDGSYDGIYARRFAADGTPLEDREDRINTRTVASQVLPAVAIDADGDIVHAWASAGQDGDSYAVITRRYRGDEPIDLATDLRDDRDPVYAGDRIQYTATVSNLHAPSFDTGTAWDTAVGAAANPTISLVLPSGATVLSAPAATPAATCTTRGTSVSCHFASPLSAGTQARLSFALSAPTAGALSVAATASSPSYDPDLANNTDTESTQVNCNPGVLRFSANTYGVTESAANGTAQVERVGGSCGAATVQVETAPGGSALPGADYTDTSAVLSWADGESGTKDFLVPLVDDALDEDTEGVRMVLSAVTGAQAGERDRARLLIADDDASPRINFTSTAQSVTEGAQLVTVTAVLSAVSGRNVALPLMYSGTATAGSDYFMGAAALTIPAGQASASTQIEVADDAVGETTETVVVKMGNPTGATAGSLSTFTLSIADNDGGSPPPTVSFTAATSIGGEAQNRNATVQLSAASATAVSVPFTISGTATSGTDYTLNRSSPLSFPAGTTSVTIQTAPIDDAIVEPDETIVLTLGTPTGATLGATTVHTRTITDND